MTVQAAAHKILNELLKPMFAREIAEIALSRGYVISDAKDRVFSIRSTIEKTIRDETYNSPRLVFISTKQGRKIGLPSMEEARAADAPKHAENGGAKKQLTLELPADLFEGVQLATQAKLAADLDDTVALLVKKGLSEFAPKIRERLLHQIESM